MTRARILPPGQTMPPLPSTPAGGATARPGARTGGRGQRRGRHRHADRFAVLNAFVDGTARSLPRAAALAWLVLWRDTRDGVARTSMVDIARRVGCDERSAKRSVRLLVDAGLVEVVRRGGKWRGVSTYKVTPVSPCMGAKRCQNR